MQEPWLPLKGKNPNSRLKSVYQQLAYAQGIDYFNRRAYTDAIGYFSKSLKYPVDIKLQSEAYFGRVMHSIDKKIQ